MSMKKVYKGHANKSGVYKIVNTTNGRIYIGSCKLFKVRAREHLKALSENRHSNKFLQNDFNKCGEIAFEFHVIEVVGSGQKNRLLVEQQYIDQHYDKQKQCYNIARQTNNSSRSCFSKSPEETRKKLSKAQKGKKVSMKTRKKISRARKDIKFSEEHKNKLAAKKKGKKLSQATRQKMSQAHKTPEALSRLKETYDKHKKYIIARQQEAVSKTHTLINPNGEIVRVKNLNKFCKERNMHSSGFSNLLRKLDENATYKGWKYLGSSK